MANPSVKRDKRQEKKTSMYAIVYHFVIQIQSCRVWYKYSNVEIYIYFVYCNYTITFLLNCEWIKSSKFTAFLLRLSRVATILVSFFWFLFDLFYQKRFLDNHFETRVVEKLSAILLFLYLLIIIDGTRNRIIATDVLPSVALLSYRSTVYFASDVG